MQEKIINNVTLVKYGIVKGIDTEICKRGVQVIETYKNKSIFIRILKRLKRNFKFINVDFIYNKSLKAIPTDYIIIFDSVDLASDVEYLRRIHPNKKILAWYRNPVKKSALPTLVKGADEIWSYSEEESKRYGLRYHLPFYIAEKPETSEESKTDVLFVGIDKGRYNSIMDCKKILENHNISTDFYIVPDHDYQLCNKKEYTKALPYNEVLKRINLNKCILDLYIDPCTGLSFRPLESIFFQKKLITNHELIYKEPFYNKNNVFLLGKDSVDDLKLFLSRPYEKIDSTIVSEYSFEKWITDLTC